MNPSRIPIITPEVTPRSAKIPRVQGVVLAAGRSTRFGRNNKLLAPIRDKLVVEHVAHTLLTSRLNSVAIVVGYDAERVIEVIDTDSVQIVHNHKFSDGLSTSVHAGVKVATDNNADAVLFAMGDIPNVSVRSINILIDTFTHNEAGILAAAYKGRRGNPVIFDRRYFSDLRNTRGDTGGREILLSADDAVLVETGDPSVRMDIDRPDDLDRFR